ncbi:MAG: helix-turn-helix domain-containing protein [Prevotella sp.]|nr:helix-turn-helix domain-containing protein [Prevotella sp.]
MVNINSLLDQGGNIKIEVRPEDLVMFAESIIERMEASHQKRLEDGKACETETYLTTKEARELLNVCDGTLITWAKRGYLVPHKVGKKKRYAMSDIKRVLYGEKNNTVTAYCKRKAKEV